MVETDQQPTRQLSHVIPEVGVIDIDVPIDSATETGTRSFDLSRPVVPNFDQLRERAATLRKEEKCEFSLNEGLNAVGFGPAQVILAFVVGWVYMADGIELILMSYIIPIISDELELDPWQGPMIASVVFLGMLLGSYPCGVLADRYGRKRMIQVLMIFACLGSFGSALVPEYYSLLVCRGVVGFTLGGCGPLAFNLFAEQLPVARRGFYLTVIALFWCLGSIVEAFLAWYILPRYGWRALLAVSSAPLAAVFLLLPLVCESPRYYLICNRIGEAMDVLEYMSRKNKKLLPAGQLAGMKVDQEVSRGSIRDLFASRLLTMITILVLLNWFMNSFLYYGIILLTPVFFDAREYTESDIYFYSLIASTSEAPSLIFAGLIVDYLGRKGTMALLFVVTGFAFLGMMFPTGPVLSVFFVVMARGAVFATFQIIFVYTPEVYPTSCRGTGMGLASALSRIAGIVTPYVADSIMPWWYFAPFLIYAVASFCGAVVSILLPVETKGRAMADTTTETVEQVEEVAVIDVELDEIQREEEELEDQNVHDVE